MVAASGKWQAYQSCKFEDKHCTQVESLKWFHFSNKRIAINLKLLLAADMTSLSNQYYALAY